MFKTHCIYSQYAFNLFQICAVENPTKKRCQNTRCFNFWIIKYVALWEEVRVMCFLVNPSVFMKLQNSWKMASSP